MIIIFNDNLVSISDSDGENFEKIELENYTVDFRTHPTLNCLDVNVKKNGKYVVKARSNNLVMIDNRKK